LSVAAGVNDSIYVPPYAADINPIGTLFFAYKFSPNL